MFVENIPLLLISMDLVEAKFLAYHLFIEEYAHTDI